MGEFSIEKAVRAISERFTDEQREEQQERSQAAIGRVDPNSPQARRQRLRRLEDATRKQISLLSSSPAGELRSSRLTVALNRLGELMAEQGNYVGAIAVTVDQTRSETYRNILDAIERPDDEMCECPTEEVRQDGNLVRVSPRFKAQTITTPGGERNLIKCAKCGFMNAK